MDGIFLAGRILFALVFVASGAHHLLAPRADAGFIASRGVPMAFTATVTSGAYIVLAGLMVVFGVWIDLAGLMLAVFAAATALLVHHFWTFDGEQRVQSLFDHLKDLALAGAGLFLFALGAGFGEEIGLMATAPLFDL
jgi:putative oxidoreductase